MRRLDNRAANGRGGAAAGGVASAGGMALGWQRADQPFETVWNRFAPWLAASLAVMAATGIAQTLGDPVREFTATSYWLKLALLVCCALGTLLLNRAARRMPRTEFSFPAKVAAAALLLCWLALPLLGRMIGYDLAIFGSLSLRT